MRRQQQHLEFVIFAVLGKMIQAQPIGTLKQKKKITFQRLSLQHETCNDECQQFNEFKGQNQRFLFQETSYNQNYLTLEDCKQELKQLEWKRNSLRRKRKRFYKNHKALPKRSCNFQLIKNIRKINKKNQINDFPAHIMAGRLGLTRRQIYYLQQNQSQNDNQESCFAINSTHIRWIKKKINVLTVEQLWSAIQLYQTFMEQFHLNIKDLCLESFRRIMKKYCGVSYKKPLKKDRRSTGTTHINTRLNYTIEFLSLHKADFNFIFIDETSLGHSYSPPKCWQLKKKRKVQIQTMRQQQISILGALGTKGFLGYQIVQGTINAKVYYDHLISLLKMLRKQYGEEDFAIILDNSQIHRSKIIKKVLNCVIHKFLPTYTPQLNPIEKLWNSFKQNLNRQGDLLTIGIYNHIHKYFNSIEKERLDSYIYSIIPYLQMAIFKEVF